MMKKYDERHLFKDKCLSFLSKNVAMFLDMIYNSPKT